MPLPIQSAPIYTLTIPSTKKDIKYRPFLVKEEKSLLIAQMSNSVDIMLDTLKEVIKSCVLDKIDINSLASFDFEYIFSQLRSVSVGETVTLTLRCDTCEDEDAFAKVTVNLAELKVEIPKDFSNKIVLYDKVGVIMKYPTIKDLTDVQLNSRDIDMMFDVVGNCIDAIFDEEQMYKVSEQPKEEIREFLTNLTGKQFKMIEEYFDSLPKLKKELEYSCPVCKTEYKKTVAGLANFF
jgi:hypothetical protein